MIKSYRQDALGSYYLTPGAVQEFKVTVTVAPRPARTPEG